ncbi:type II toxin-antitoxin system VapB family antitoxin [Geodermatophilus sp. SYSU D00691]
MARRTSRRRSSCATRTPPRTGRRRAGGWHSQGSSASSAYDRRLLPSRASRRVGAPAREQRGPGPAVRVGPDGGPGRGRTAEVVPLIFKAVREGRPYPDHGMTTKDWALIPPRQVRLDTLVTTKRELALDALLADDSTFYGDLFPHAVLWHGELYLEDGLHRALRAALQQRNVIHVRVLDLDALMPVSQAASGPTTETLPAQPPVPAPQPRER